ncbi:MAG: DUF222 domain-containing protein, partial [Actinomycetota bacterium]
RMFAIQEETQTVTEMEVERYRGLVPRSAAYPHERHRLELEDRMTALQGELNAAHAAHVALIAEHLEAGYWGHHDGIMTPASFLTWKLGLTPYEANRLLKIAVGLKALPLIQKAFAEGRLSLQQAGLLVEIAEPVVESRLLEYALGLSGAQLVRFAGHYRRALRAEQDTAHKERFLSTRHHGDGSWTITGRLSSVNGAVIDKALDAALEQMIKDGAERGDDAEDPFAARAADCLLHLSESFLSGGDGIRKAHERHTVTLHVDLEDLLGDDGIAKIQGGGITGTKTEKELLEGGASLVEMIHHDGVILSVSDKRRPNTALKRALAARDQHCVWPGCAHTAYLDNHHYEWVVEDGKTEFTNLWPLCWNHHPLVHEGKVTIEKTPEGLVFRDRHGKVIERDPIEAGGAQIESLNRERGIEITRETCLPGWGGEPGDLVYVADLALTHRYYELKAAGGSNDDLLPGGRDGPDP